MAPRIVALLLLAMAGSCSPRHVSKSDLVGQWCANADSLRRLSPDGKPDARLRLASDGTFIGEGIPRTMAELNVQRNARISANGSWRLAQRDALQIVELEYRTPGVARFSGELVVERDRSGIRLYFNLSDPDLNERFTFERVSTPK